MDVDILKWVFDGLGTAFITFILGLFGGCVGGHIYYKFSVKNKNIQKQKAGNVKNQSQTTINNYNNGITEDKAKEIYKEQQSITLEKCSSVSLTVANDRINQFRDTLLPRIEAIESNFESLADPSFNATLAKAQFSAACSDSKNDYEILSELLVHRIKHKKDIKKHASISKVIEVIDYVDEDSLNALTVFNAVERFIPNIGEINKGLNILDATYKKIGVNNLPRDKKWIDNLQVLGLCVTENSTQILDLFDYFNNVLQGYSMPGIKVGSPNYNKAINMISDNSLPADVLINHEIFKGYSRIPIVDKDGIYKLEIKNNKTGLTKPLNDKQRECLLSIYGMYENDKEVLKKCKKSFIEYLNKFENISKVRVWLKTIKTGLYINSAGKILAHANAKNIDSSLPDFD